MPKITYAVARPPIAQVITPFQFFSFPTIAVIGVIDFVIRSLPASTEEMTLSPPDRLKLRSQGHNSHFITYGDSQNLNRLTSLYRDDSPVIIICDERDSSKIKEKNKEKNFFVIEYTITKEFPNKTPEINFHKENFFIYIGQYIDISKINEEKYTVNLTALTHLTTLPNHHAVMSCGYSFEKSEIFFSTNQDDYENAIIDSANVIKELRNQYKHSHSDILVCSPSVSWKTIDSAKSISHKMYKKDPSRRKFVQSLLRRDGYITQIKINEENANPEYIEDKMNTEPAILRRMELWATSNILAIRASSNMTPVYRLPELQWKILPKLRNLSMATQMNREAKSQPSITKRKINRGAIEISNSITKLIPKRIQEEIIHTDGTIINYGEIPIELINDNGIPLSMRKNITRIPMIPGEQMLRHTLRGTQIHLDDTEIVNILCIRGLQEEDKLFNTLKDQLLIVNKETILSITIKDAKCIEDIYEIINEKKYAILIFDGHSEYIDHDGSSRLVLDGKPISIDEDQPDILCPPIVILSSCNTHPIGGSHYSVVNFFLRLGAMSVLGTTLPVHGIKSSILIERILTFLGSWIESKNPSVSWAAFISTATRIQYVDETIIHCMSNNLWDLSNTQWEDVYETSITHLMKGQEWTENLVNKIHNYSGKSKTSIKKKIYWETFYCDVVSYINFGNPHLISIGGKSILKPKRMIK